MIASDAMTLQVMEAKAAKSETWESLGKALGISPVFLASACFAQNSLSESEADTLCSILGLGSEVKAALQRCHKKGVGASSVDKDPLIYRFFEIAYVYGDSIKEVIHEKFGDGIMSAIDFTLDIDKQEDPKGDRVVVTMNGKFLPYKKW